MTTRARLIRGGIVVLIVIAVAVVAVVLKNRSDEVGTHKGEPAVQTSTTPPTDSTLTAPPSSKAPAVDVPPALVPVRKPACPVAFAVRAADPSLYINEQEGRVRRIAVDGTAYAV